MHLKMVDRYFLEEPLTAGEHYILEGSEFHHLIHVKRARKGEEVGLVNGQGTLGIGFVEAIGKDKATITIEQIEKETPPRHALTLVQGLCKGHHLDFVLEKGTELGVTRFLLFPAERSGLRLPGDHQLERMRGVTIAAMKQCKRLFLPQLRLIPEIAKWNLRELGLEAASCLFGDLAPETPPLRRMAQESTPPFAFATGPEGGFTEKERTLLLEKGFKGVSLHTNVLRTETAAIAAAVWLYQT